MNNKFCFVLFLMISAGFVLSHAGLDHDEEAGVKTDRATDSTNEALDQSALVGERIDWQVLSGGATSAASTGFCVNGTVGQPAIGGTSSDDFRLFHGFWQGSDVIACCLIRGDINHSGIFDPLDAVYFVNFFWKAGPPPPCNSEADVNGSGSVDPLDASYLVLYLWRGGPAPVPCP